MKYFILTGEASGDLHGAKLAESIFRLDDDAVIQGIGADKMEKQGVDIVKYSHEINIMGFWEVLTKLATVKKFFNFTTEYLASWKPDALVLVDFGGFNLRIAKWAKKNNIKVFYYISPKLWAWNQKRAYKIQKYVDKMYVILPFEVEFYKQFDVEAIYVGNPLLDRIQRDENNKNKDNFILLLPGSRVQEINSILPNMLRALADFPNEKFKIAKADNLEANLLENHLNTFCPKEIQPNIEIVPDSTYELIKKAKAAIVTSGTATLETALHYTPQVVCYITNPISYWIGKKVIKVKYISLVNLILQKGLVKELIQGESSPLHIASELKQLLDENYRNKMIKGYDELWSIVGEAGASEKTARDIVSTLANSPTGG